MKKTILIAIYVIFFSKISYSKTIPWIGDVYYISNKGVHLSYVLKDLGSNYGIPVIVSPKITEMYAGELIDSPKGNVLNELSRLYQLRPYYDGNALYIYKAQEMENTIISPLYVSGKKIESYVKRSNLLDGHACQLRIMGGGDSIQISGVPVCMAQITTLIKQVDEQNLNEEQNREVITLYKLKYANASDTNYTYRNQTVIVPGIVSVLREMSEGRALPLPDNKSASLKNTGALPTFSADIRQNAVLIRDRKKNMGIYEKLMPDLDKKPTLVEISVAIIDVDAGDINQLGIDWSATARIGGGAVSFNSTNGGLTADNFSSLVSNSGDFMIRISALEQKAKAKIVSRPSVVTLNNVQAILDRSITFYTKLESEKDPRLESITAGALMRVTPRLINEGNGNRILLTLNIQDGRQDKPHSRAESLPQVQNAEIATQATLNSGQALLLGGFVQDEIVDGVNKIPLLGDIPLIGNLFKSTTNSKRSVVRLFLIKAEPREV